MLLERLELVNYCNHADKTVDFLPGLTAVIGPNGSGKSNLMGAVKLAITGDNPNAGKKEENISKRAGKKDPSFVRLRFSHGSVRATVKRNLRGTPAATLTIDGQPPVTGEGQVNARISEILGGLAADVFNGLIFVAQREVFTIFDKTPAKRAEHLQYLFSLDAAERAHDAVTKRVAQLEIPVVTADMAALANQEAATTQRIEELRTAVAGMPTHAKIAENTEAWRQVGVGCARALVLDQEILLTDNATAADESSANTYRQAAQQYAETIRTLEPLAAEATTVVREQQQREHAYAVYAEYLRRKEKLDKELVSLSLDPVLAAPAPLPPTDYWADADRQEAIVVYSNAYAAAAEAYSRINRVSGQAAVICPTCGQPAKNLLDQLPALLQTMKEKEHELRVVQARLQRSQAYEMECGSLQSLKSQQEGRIQQTERQLSLMVAPPVASPAGTDLAMVRQADELRRQLDAARRDLASAQQLTATRSAHAQAGRTALQRLRNERARIPTPSPELERQRHDVTVALAGFQQFSEHRRTVERELAVADESLRSVRSRLSDARRDIAAAADLRAFADYAGKLQALLHRDGAPKFVLHKNLRKLERRINPLLQELGADFQISTDENLSFIASFQDGMTMPGERLSPGQQVSLALCFRLAMNLSLAGQVGALYLDEPTVYLDSEKIRGLEPLFSRLRELAISTQLQIIVISHESTLAPLFDQVISL